MGVPSVVGHTVQQTAGPPLMFGVVLQELAGSDGLENIIPAEVLLYHLLLCV